MSARVLVTGARIASGYKGGEETMLEAVLQVVDWEQGRVVFEDRYRSPPEMLPPEGGRMGYRTAHVDPDRRRVIVPTFTEVVEYDLDTWERRPLLAHPTFHDLHHALRLSTGEVVVVNTGLERLQWFDGDGTLTRTAFFTDDAESRFSEDVDWRRVFSTKPHRTHVNHAVEIDGRVHATRFLQKDLVDAWTLEPLVTDMPGNPHDGTVVGEEIAFTTTSGAVHLYGRDRGEHRASHELSEFGGQAEGHLGWCRGVALDRSRAFVGFSCFRKSRWSRVYAPWLKGDTVYRPSRVGEYDLERREMVREYAFEGDLAAMAVFTVELLPDE